MGETTRIGFVGLGIMGAPMAGHLQKAGWPLFVCAGHHIPEALIAGGASLCQTHTELAQKSDVVVLMLPDTPQVEEVLFAESGIVSGLVAGKIVVDMSSISPIATKRFAARVRDRGCEYVDAPVSGGEVGAKSASLSIMAGANEATFKRVLPMLELMGKNITLVGEVGDGQTAKVANQMIVALNIAAVAEALLFAARSGADPERVRQALKGGFAASRVLDVHGERMVRRQFAPGFRIELHQKDLNIALSSARTLGLSLPHTASAQELFNACVAYGGGALDHAAMVCALERLSNCVIGDRR